MKIIVISDTHMPNKAKKLPSRLRSDLQSADLIIHAGDWKTMDVYEQLASYTKVEGVSGNVDGQDIRERFGDKQILTLGSFRIGIVHGHGTKGTTEKRALAAFIDDNVDCIIFGHSHIPVCKRLNDIVVFNPGSPTDKRRQPFYSYGIMKISGSLHVEHVFYESKE